MFPQYKSIQEETIETIMMLRSEDRRIFHYLNSKPIMRCMPSREILQRLIRKCMILPHWFVSFKNLEELD